METMIGIALLVVAGGIAWVCFAFGVFLFTRTGREGMRIAQMDVERPHRSSPEE